LKVEFSQGSGSTAENNRFDNFTIEGSAVTTADTTPPVTTIVPANSATNVASNTNPTISFNEPVRLIDNSALTNTNIDAVVELRLNNAAGATVPFDATVSGNTITVTPSAVLTNNQQYYLVLLPNLIEDFSNNSVTTAQSSTFTIGNPTAFFASNFVTVNENVGTLSFNITLTNPATSSVNLVVKTVPFSTANSNDFTLATQTLNFTSTSALTQTITIPITDDTLAEQKAEYFVLTLENPVGLTLNGTTSSTIYIIDNDVTTPTPSNQISLNYVGSFDPSGANASSCEIVVHDPASQRLFATSAIAGYLDVINFSNPASPSVISSINMAPYGGITSVAVRNGILAVASPNADETLNGSVVFFNTNGTFLKQVTVGALPDMITFTPDGTKVLTANEGQPNVAYTVDPEGSVSIIDISGAIPLLTQTNVTTLNFTAYNSQEGALMASGIRKIKATSTLSQDIEPEYITVSSNSQKAYVALQENNAIAEINLVTNTIESIWPLGTKDVSLPGNGFDVSDNNGQVLIANWPMNAFLNPDGIATYTVAGTNYIVTANEGDEKEYGTFTERTTVGASTYTLDPAIFPNAAILKQSTNLGRFRTTNVNGNTDVDADFEVINCVGSRSFSIFNANTKQIVYDSGDAFERYTAATQPTLFNSDHSTNSIKNRSRAKGPEPEGVTISKIGTETFAFITLERIGGVMVYNITDPNNAVFVDYKNSRSTSAYAGDNGPEGIIYIAAADSPNGTPYVIVANKISGTLTIFEVNTTTLETTNFNNQSTTFNLFPNPSSNDGIVYLNRTADIAIYDLTGKLILTQTEAQIINTNGFSKGTYLVKTSEGIVKKLVVK
jgi:hypothetical protein